MEQPLGPDPTPFRLCQAGAEGPQPGVLWVWGRPSVGRAVPSPACGDVGAVWDQAGPLALAGWGRGAGRVGSLRPGLGLASRPRFVTQLLEHYR